MFSHLSKSTLVQAALFKNKPVYVQFYITARCNLTCQQCNIIYSNADVRECNIDEVKRIADNLAKLGVAIILLTGGEPFVRKDLPEIIKAFSTRGIHVRMQTNGLASEEKIIQAIEAGGKDISISLDSLRPSIQDQVNGGFNRSWEKAIEVISLFSKHLPKDKSFAALGCVLQPDNLKDIEQVIRFGTKIGWHVSLVPAHVTSYSKPRGFRTFDKSLLFPPEMYGAVDNLLDKVGIMRDQGYLLYDSDQYLNDIKSFIRNEPTSWRDRNHGVCDSPNLYFAILPNGEFAPCCDHRMPNGTNTYAKDFPKIYNDSLWRSEVKGVVSSCEGCMYGSYPEMTISMRFMAAKLQRLRTFFTSPPDKPWPLSTDELLHLAKEIREQPTTECNA